MVTIEQLPESERKAFFSRVMNPWQHGGGPRRDEFRDRYAIATDTYDPQVKRRIEETYKTSEVVAEMERWSVGYYNTWKRVSRKLAVAYKRKPKRRLDRSKSESAKMSSYYRRIGFDARALEWQRLSIIMNRLVVLVVERTDDNGKSVTDFDVATGYESEVWLEPGRSVTSAPDILAQRLSSSWAPSTDEPVIRTADASSYRFWNSNGDELTSMRKEHGLGMFPGADMLSAHMPGGYYFDYRPWRSATKATIDIGLIAASMNWTRKTQCRKLISVLTSADADEVPDGQSLTHHERPVMLNGPEIQLIVNDLNTGVEGFLAHIKSIQDEIAEQMTGAASTFVDPDPAMQSAGVGAVAQHEAISEVRESQIASLERFEQRMAVLLAKQSTKLGDKDKFSAALAEEKFRIRWPPLAFQDTPEARVRAWSEQTKFGISDQVDALVELEGISEDEAEERLMAIAERRAKLDEFRAKRNQQADPMADPTTLPLAEAPGESLAETQGRAGGSVDAQGNPTSPHAADTSASPLTPTDAKGAIVSSVADVQALALNGAQIASLKEMAIAVADGQLPAEFVIRMMPIAFPTIEDAVARNLFAPLIGFKAKEEPKPAPFPGKPPPAPTAE